LAFCISAACASPQAARYVQLTSAFRATAPANAESRRSNAPLFDGSLPLQRSAFVRAVLDRNPSLEAARQAWRASLAQYPETSALDDPMLEYSFAPLSIGSSHMDYGQTVTLSQRFPWPGKIALRGDVALAEAEATREDFESARRSLAVMAATSFVEYYAVERSLEVNDAHRRLVEELKRASEGQYAAGEATQREPLQAEVELALIAREQLALEARKSVLVAQMNGLLHRAPESPLPPPPPQLEAALQEVGSSETLRAQALEARPELRAARAQLRARQAAIELAERGYYPDFGVMVSYSSMWAAAEHRWMAGLGITLPLQRGSRHAAVDGAEAMLAGGRAGLESDHDEVAVEVERRRQEIIEAQRTVRLYVDRLLPATRAQIEVARIGYSTGRTPFQEMLEAERTLRTAELGHQEALARLGRTWAELDRAVGRIPGIERAGDTP
jgi:outer membrane protein TolC